MHVFNFLSKSVAIDQYLVFYFHLFCFCCVSAARMMFEMDSKAPTQAKALQLATAVNSQLDGVSPKVLVHYHTYHTYINY